KNEQREAPMTTVFFASGNHMQFREDMARRGLPIDLDPKLEHPEQRGDFLAPPLEARGAANHPHVGLEGLTGIQSDFAGGAPTPKLPAWGSYEPWSRLIRQAIVWAGMGDPYEARLDIEAESDPLYEKRDRLLYAWETCYDPQSTINSRTLNQAVQDIR